ncbi:hypothetical protein [Aliivibrio sp. EL58]|uniref:hypothetical protein n=1 Tax=Aliivibrio sp. EL58 TaxID=2107582 RepID=UPI000EFC73EB|nr:hypothetical protein [Aliivibrio sp. EL58]
MLKSSELYSRLTKYLYSHNWTLSNEVSSEILTLWVNDTLNESIQLPTQTEQGFSHPRAEKTLIEASRDLADILNITVDDLLNLLMPPSDHIHIRAAGEAIEHGRINFRTNHKIESAIYSIIKSAAKAFIVIDSKKDKKKNQPNKSEVVETYLSSVNTVLPTGGSFIYNLDIDLTQTDGLDQPESLQRYVNSKLAVAFNELYNIEDVDTLSTANLIRKGLNQNICSHFVDLFGTDVEIIECSFDWDKSEPAPQIKSNHLVFTRKHRAKVQKLKEKFNSSKEIPLNSVNALLKRLEIKSEFALIQLKIQIEGAERTCDAEIDLDIAQRLMTTLGENIQQPVTINATAWVEKTASKHHYSLLDITSICSEKGKNIALFS